MRLLRYDHDYSRRHFMKSLARGVAGAGVLMPLWDAIAQSGDASKAYPDELLSIEGYTRGRLKNGDLITAANVDLVRDLLEPIKYQQIKTMGRRLKLAPTTGDITRLSPWEYLEATLRNRGKAQFDGNGNIVVDGGKPWIGGNPFPDAKTGIEIFASITLSWGRHDAAFYAIKEYDLGVEGDVRYNYDAGWAEMSPVARVCMEPMPYWPAHEDKLRFQSIFFASPDSAKGTSFLNVWPYDQHSFPDLYGYVPAFKRIRQFPTDQRFEPLIPGSTLYLSDAWTAGDPLYTWGNYQIIGRGPALAAISGGWNADHPNWEHKTHGGPKGKTFWDTTVELVPEAILVSAEPTGFKRAPVSKKHVWFDARTMLPIAMVTFDRRGDPYHSFDGAYALYESGEHRFMDGRHPYWSWAHVHAFDIQTGRMTRLEQVKSITGGHATAVNDPAIYDRYLTNAALMHLGNG
ncbi:DUF1329 domain-containing protein [Solimonas terrae]|uniref:DUF1329 domain-containing protein n=1 Tax=Solimonas terrae TaxID=1396819 RepID=A0A6M2BPF9_9GAMM|nr:DUF1329 domain-containing protein [Solimonas terrae]NGY04486.1 DUF1329 domain-containing protein [Solimonas terrae]